MEFEVLESFQNPFRKASMRIKFAILATTDRESLSLANIKDWTFPSFFRSLRWTSFTKETIAPRRNFLKHFAKMKKFYLNDLSSHLDNSKNKWIMSYVDTILRALKAINALQKAIRIVGSKLYPLSVKAPISFWVKSLASAKNWLKKEESDYINLSHW